MKDAFDLHQLRVFLVVTQQGTLRNAASVLGITASAISQTIAAMERALEVTLFVRESRPLRLTPEGRRLVVEGTELVRCADRVAARVRSGKLGLQAMRLGLGESADATIGPWLLSRLYSRLAQLGAYSGLTKPLTEKLLAHKLDVILCAGPNLDGIGWRRLEAYREDFLLVTARAIDAPRSTAEFRSLAQKIPFVGYNNDSSDQIRSNRLLSSLGIIPSKYIAVSSSYNLVGMVAQVGGFGLLPPTNIWCGRQFVKDIAISPITNGKRIVRTMWAVGSNSVADEQIALVANEAKYVMREYMLKELKALSLGLENYVAIH